MLRDLLRTVEGDWPFESVFELLSHPYVRLVADDALAPFSLVCKAVAANGRPTVKLSDNPNKAMGPADEIARYKRVFGVGEQERVEVVV